MKTKIRILLSLIISSVISLQAQTSDSFSLKLSGTVGTEKTNLYLYANNGIIRGLVQEQGNPDNYSNLLGYIDEEKDSVYLLAYSFTGEETFLSPAPEKTGFFKLSRDLKKGEWQNYPDTFKINFTNIENFKDTIYTPINNSIKGVYERGSAHCNAFVKISKKRKNKYSADMYDECILQYGDSTYYKDFEIGYKQKTNSLFLKDVPVVSIYDEEMKKVRAYLLFDSISGLKKILLFDYPWYDAYQQVKP